MKRFFPISALIICYTQLSYSEKAPVRFGKIDIADLEMQTYASDTSAPAVVLCDYGVFDANTFDFNRILRIKILKKEGLDWANKTFPGSEKTAIRGITYNLENGEIVETKLKNESIFKERVFEDYYRLRVAMPNVKVGSVFDIAFTFPGIPGSWYFQRSIPVKWSELIIQISPYVDFRKNFYGYETLEVNTDGRWVGKDMPAFKEEAYTNSVENYITKFELEVLSIQFPGYYKAYTTSWEAVATLLYNSDYFGAAIKGNIFLNPFASEIEKKYTSDQDKLRAAYDFIKLVKWDEVESIFSTYPNLSSAYNKKIGNSADINLMLVSLLKKLDITSYPIVMSTRDNGLLGFFPSLDKLNYVIAYAKIGDQVFLLDATEEFLPSNLLPERALNYQGRVMQDVKSFPVDLTPKGKDRQMALYNLSFNNDLNLTGTAEFARYDYSAFDFRTNYREFNSQDEFLEDRENSYNGLVIKNFSVENLDSIYLPIKDKYEIEVRNATTVINDNIYLNPMLFHQLTENPFIIENRKYPVDYGYMVDKAIIINYEIPAGYQVVELPKQAAVKLPENNASFIYSAANINGKITVTYRFNINKITFLPYEYFNLKEFYNQIIKKHAEPIVLKKV